LNADGDVDLLSILHDFGVVLLAYLQLSVIFCGIGVATPPYSLSNEPSHVTDTTRLE
jgi:hypothetical protein